MRKSVLPVTLAAVAAVSLLGGCEQEIVKQFQAEQELVAAGGEVPAGRFWSEITFCRKIGKKTGKRIGRGDTFTMAAKSYVNGLVDFQNVPLDRIHSVHLVWIKPDGKEMFRKFAEVRQGREESGEFRTVINWLDAEDLHKIKSDTLLTAEPTFTLNSRFNTSLKKERAPGLYHFRVYLDRALLLEEPFTVTKG